MVIRVKPETLAELKALQAEIEQTVGIRPLMSEVVSRVIRDGVEVVRKRPAFAVDTAPKTKA